MLCNQNHRAMRKLALIISLTAFSTMTMKGQNSNAMNNDRETIAVLSMDSRGLNIDNVSMGNLVRLELEKTQRFEVMDKYDVAHTMEEAGIDISTCFGKNQLVEAGQILGSQNMLTGAVEKFGEKIIYTLRLIDVRGARIERTSVIEFVNQVEDIQTMTTLIVQDLLDIEMDQVKYEMLASFDKPITNSRTSVNLNGPRFGIQVFQGQVADRLTAAKSEGGFGMNYPVMSVFGYQWETQYISAGDFQALFEFIPTVNGIETGNPSFSLTVLHGMRYDGWEFGFGPAFRVTRMGQGYYDESDNWVLSDEVPQGVNAELITNIDSRGPVKLNTGLILALGKTIHSGYLNLPINVYWSPSPQLNSNIFGVILGFNIAKAPVNRTPNS